MDTGEVVQKAPNTLLKHGDLSGADCVRMTGGIETSDTVENITAMLVGCNISSYHSSTFRQVTGQPAIASYIRLAQNAIPLISFEAGNSRQVIMH